MQASEAGTPEPESFILARGLRKTFRRGSEQVEAVRGVDLGLPVGVFAVILGPSGGGKSTLLHLLGGIERPTAGEIRIAGEALEKAGEEELTRFRRDHIGFIFQFYNLLPSQSAMDNVALPLLARGTPWPLARRRAAELLERVGLSARLKHHPAELSGGEQQRVAIARAVVASPDLVLADEPTGDLDTATTEEILALLSDLNRDLGVTLLVATHNPRIADFASLRYEMRDGLLHQQDGAGP
ncbi:MAG TPA: ABC transporter ATP-binding protein [Anaerolineaceae bacterium]|nr:ABC transporter ATP-binding protein [Anaerolineaceae bacterium]